MAYEIRNLDQLLQLLDQGQFQPEVMNAIAELQTTLRDHQHHHGGKPKGKIALTLNFEIQKSGDVAIKGELAVTSPKAPAASGVAYVDDDGQLTLESPMLTRMRGGVRDVVEPDRSFKDAAE